MTKNPDPAALPEGLESRLYEIHFELDGAEREAAMDALLRDHAAYATELRERARALTRSDNLLGRVRSQLEQPQVPERIGPFEVRDLLGHGGFGAVYLAEQQEPVKRMVALKVLQPGRIDSRSLQRFDSERQVLARMRHAAIAQVYDAGETEDGVPYFAMELVDGQPITEWCDRRGLGVEARLQLFLKVCAAVHHAHQRGVVHRDIKPSNVLVHEEDGGGLPKIIDFGIAKLLGEDPGGNPVVTLDGALVGTPGYMSPEQALCEPVDTRTDVYSLGVLLYELLTGELPFSREALRNASLAELLRMLGKDEPCRPSAALSQHGEVAESAARRRQTDVQGLLRNLRGDLDWVLLKAIARAPDDRYASVVGLAEDVSRYLANEPVSVREHAAWYLARKFVARHRLGVALTAGLLTAVLAGISGLAWALGEVDHARRQALARGDEVTRQRDAAVANAYAADLATAQLALNAGDVHTARGCLEAAPLGLRGWEWRHLAAQSEHSRRRIETEKEVIDVTWLDEERFLGFAFQDAIGIWNATDGELESSLKGWKGTFRRFALDRERDRVVVANDEGVFLWNVRTGERLRKLLPASGEVQCLALTGDRELLAVGSRGRTLQLVRLDGEAPPLRLPALSDHPTALLFLDGDKQLLVALDSGPIQRLDAATGEVLEVLEGHVDAVDALLLHPDRGLLFSASRDTTVRVWNSSSGALRLALQCEVGVRRLALSPKGDFLYGCGGWADGRVMAWDTGTFSLLGRYHGHRSGVLSVALDPTGARLVTTSRDRTMRIWSGSPPRRGIRLHAGRDARDLAVDEEGTRFASASHHGLVTVWNAATLRAELRLQTGEKWAGCALGREHVYVAGRGPSVKAFALPDGKLGATGSVRGSYVERLAVDPDERWLVGGHGERLLVWELPDLSLRHVLDLPVGGSRLVYDRRRGSFTIACADGKLRWVDPREGRVRDELPMKSEKPWLSTIHQRGDLLVAAGPETPMFVSRGDAAAVERVKISASSLAISPDGERIATGGADQKVRLWNANTLTQMLVLSGPSYGVLEVRFVAGGHRIIALSHRWSAPSYVHVWDAPLDATVSR